MIPYGKQDITKEDIDAVIEVLKSDFLTQGPKVPEFENALAEISNSKYALAVNSATSALHIACMALGLKEGDWLWTSPITFVASANVGIYCGASVDLVDIDPLTNNMCPIKLEEKLIQANLNNKLPKVLIPVHLSGQSCEMSKIKKLCDKYSVRIIEDASHAVGGYYEGEPIGNCKYSDITVFSFHPVKIITTGEGGAALTNDPVLAKNMSLHRSHGITREESQMSGSSHGPWYYQQLSLGYNYRMTDIQASLGLSQLSRLKSYVEKRHEISGRYDDFLKDLPLKVPYHSPNSYSAVHLYVIRLKLNEIDMSHREVFENLRRLEIGVNLHYIPIHLHPFYKNKGFNYGDFPESEKYYSEAISLPMYTNLSLAAQDKVIEALVASLESI